MVNTRARWASEPLADGLASGRSGTVSHGLAAGGWTRGMRTAPLTAIALGEGEVQCREELSGTREHYQRAA